MSESRVERLLSQEAPWTPCSPELRERTLAALAEVRRRPRVGPWAGVVAAAVLSGVVWMYMKPDPARGPEPSVVRIDPVGVLGPPALDQLALSAERSLRSEAQEILEDTGRFTRRVLAQLPFTGGS
jgi:hypothetical protein